MSVSKITVLVVEMDRKPYLKTMNNKLIEFNRIVDGNIELIEYERNVLLICSEEELHQKEFNKTIGEHKIYGTFFFYSYVRFQNFYLLMIYN